MVDGLKEALHADFENGKREYGLSASKVATTLGKTPRSSWPYQMMDGELPMTIQMVHGWQQLTGGANLMRWLAGDKFLVAEVASGSRRENTANTVREFAEFLEATARADSDGKITDSEIAEIERESLDAISAIMAEVQFLRKRAFQSRSGRKGSLRAAS